MTAPQTPFDVEFERSEIVRSPTLPPDGFHRVPFEVYHSWDAASHSRLEDCRRSLAYCRYRIDNPDSEDDGKPSWVKGLRDGATLVGDAAHCGILEPDELTKRYARRPEGLNLSTKRDQSVLVELARSLGYFGDTYDALAPGPESPVILHPEVYDTAIAIRDSVWVREWGEKARRILRAATATEESAVATDPETGCPMKARVDVASDRLGVLADVKTSRDAARERFSRAIHTYGIDRQFAHYGRVYLTLGRHLPHRVVIAIENTKPHEVGVRTINTESMAAACDEIDALLKLYAEAVRTGHWAGYEEDPPTIGRPAWALPHDHEGEF